MCKRILLLVFILSFVLIPSANAKNIIWVAMNQDGDRDGNYLNDFQEFTDGLKAEGYTVDIRLGYWDALTDAKVLELNAADLVLFSRSIQSGTFATNAAEVALWNSVKTPMLLCSPYVLRKGRWNWVLDDSTIPYNAGDQGCPLMNVLVTSHPIFAGVSLDANNQLEFADPTLCSGNCSFAPTNQVGNGTMIAKTVPTTLVQDWAWITEWQKGVEFYSGSGTFAGGHRLFLSAGAHETAGNGNTYNKWSGYNLTPEGWKLYLNAVKYMIGDDPRQASKPYPTYNQTEVVKNTVLSWRPGPGADKHIVFYGTDFNDVNDATMASYSNTVTALELNTDVNSINSVLEYGKTYYWRVDEVGTSGDPVVGIVWNFTTEPKGYPLAGSHITAAANDPAFFDEDAQDPNSTCNGAGLDANDMHGTARNTMWLAQLPDDGQPGDAYIQYKFDMPYKFNDMRIWNYNEGDPLNGYGAKDINILYSLDGENWSQLGDTVTLEMAPGDNTCTANAPIDMQGVAAQYVKVVFLSSLSEGDQLYGISEVRFTTMPTYATLLTPANAATNQALDVAMTWAAGRDAVEHRVYYSTDANNMGSAHIADTTSFVPTDLQLSQTYYWRVDEVNNAEAYPIWQSPARSFSTVTFIVVDNFETYGSAEEDYIWAVWKDGVETSANGGSEIGKGIVPAAGRVPGLSTTVIHTGTYALPVSYDNTAASGLSQVSAQTVNLPIGTANWTNGAPTTLVIWVCGDINNIAGQDRLYAKIGSDKVLFTGDLSKPRWMQFNVPLTGINLSNVSSLTIGIEKTGTTGGKGVVYLDDIALYRVAPAIPTEQIWIEMESGTVTPIYQVLSTIGGASGGKYVGVPDGGGDTSANPPDPNATDTLTFTVTGGVYEIDYRMYTQGAAGVSDSTWVRISNATAVKTTTGVDVTLSPTGSTVANGWVNTNNMTMASNWHWVTVISGNNSNLPVQWTLPAGTHTLKISNREDGLFIDCIVIWKVSD